MTPSIYNFPDVVREDTISSRQFTITRTVSGVTNPEDLTGAIIKCTFKHEEETVLKEIGSGITVTNPSGGVFVIDAFTLSKAGNYAFDIEITFSNDTKKTYIKGSIKILSDVTA